MSNTWHMPCALFVVGCVICWESSREIEVMSEVFPVFYAH